MRTLFLLRRNKHRRLLPPPLLPARMYFLFIYQSENKNNIYRCSVCIYCIYPSSYVFSFFFKRVKHGRCLPATLLPIYYYE